MRNTKYIKVNCFFNIVKKNLIFNCMLLNAFINYLLATYFCLKILENKHDMFRSYETVSWAIAIGLHPSSCVVCLALMIFYYYVFETTRPYVINFNLRYFKNKIFV